MLGDQLVPGAKTHRAGAPAAEVAIRFGATEDEGLEYRVIDETVALDAVSVDLTEDVPAGAVILSVQGNQETAGATGGTTDNVGIGPVANPDLYSPVVGAVTLNGKINHIPSHAVLSSLEDIQVNAVTSAGAIGDTAVGGTHRVRIVYSVLSSLDDAS